MSLIYQKSKLVNGAFQDASGNPVSGGYLTWTLNHDSNIQTLAGPTGSQVAAGVTVTTPLDANGNVIPNQYIWANSLLTPSGSYYTVKLYNNSGLSVWSSQQIFELEYEATIDLGALTPVVP